MAKREATPEEYERQEAEKDRELERRAKEDPGADFTRKSQIESMNYFEKPLQTPPMDDAQSRARAPKKT